MRREKQKLKLLPWKVWKSKKASLETRPINQPKGDTWPQCVPRHHGAINVGVEPQAPQQKKKKNSYSFDHPKYGRSRNRGAADDPDYTFVYKTKQWRGWSWRPSNQWTSSVQNRLVGPQSLMRRYKAMMNLYTVGKITHHQCSMKTLLIRE